MLNVLEICRLLEANGCSMTYERACARGYVLPGLDRPLFIKHYVTGRSTGHQPFLLHPAWGHGRCWEVSWNDISEFVCVDVASGGKDSLNLAPGKAGAFEFAGEGWGLTQDQQIAAQRPN